MAQVIKPRHPESFIPLPEIIMRVLQNCLEKKKGLSARTCITSMRIIGDLDVDTLRNCIRSVVCRHDSLSAQYVIVNNIPTIHVDWRRGDNLETTDLLESPTEHEEIRQLVQAFVDHEFNIFSDPLFGFKLITLSNHEHVLISAFDHLISDGTSVEIVNREIWTLYNQFVQGLPLDLSRPSIQLPDYYVWLSQTHDAWKGIHEDYWRTHLAGAPAAEIPVDNAVTEVMSPAVEVAHILLDGELSIGLAKVARGERVFLALVVLTLYIVVMSHWCSQRDLLVCFLCNGRFLPELKNMTGCIVDVLYLRVKIAHKDIFRDLLRRVITEFDSAIHHRDFNRVPFIIAECKTELVFNWITTNLKSPRRDIEEFHSITAHRDINAIPFVVPECNADLNFIWRAENFEQSQRTQQSHMPGHIRLQPFPFLARPSPCAGNFELLFYETVAGICVRIKYRANSIAPSTVARFERNLRALAVGFVRDPEARIESIALETQ